MVLLCLKNSQKFVNSNMPWMHDICECMETVVCDELTINERQKTDMQFCQMLREVRQGSFSAETLATLQSRDISTTMSAKYQKLQATAQSSVRLFPARLGYFRLFLLKQDSPISSYGWSAWES